MKKLILLVNIGKAPLINAKKSVNVLQGIRERYYKDSEIKKWLNGGNIREFKR